MAYEKAVESLHHAERNCTQRTDTSLADERGKHLCPGKTTLSDHAVLYLPVSTFVDTGFLFTLCKEKLMKRHLNTCYRLVWNHITGAFVVASELARSRGKRGGVAVTVSCRSHVTPGAGC